MKKMVKLLSAAFIAIGLVGVAGAQSPGSLYIPGHTIKDQGISLKPWGSGTIAETDEVAFEGVNSVRIHTRNYFQGGVLSFAKPIDVSASFKDANDLLEITFRTAESLGAIKAVPTGGRGPGGGRGGPGGGRFGGSGGGSGGGGDAGGLLNTPGVGMTVGQRGGIPGRGGAGQTGTRNPAAQFGGQQPGAIPGAAAAPAETLEKLRIIVTTSDNLRSELYIPVSSSFSAERGWRSTSFPLSAILGFERTNKVIKDLAISADGQTTLFIGGVRLVNDSTPISADVNVETLNLAQGDKVELKARGYGGSTLLKYEWDFDDKDGIQVDATGATIERVFNKPGTYKITVTISDMYGRKKPVTKTIMATVNA